MQANLTLPESPDGILGDLAIAEANRLIRTERGRPDVRCECLAFTVAKRSLELEPGLTRKTIDWVEDLDKAHVRAEETSDA